MDSTSHGRYTVDLWTMCLWTSEEGKGVGWWWWKKTLCSLNLCCSSVNCINEWILKIYIIMYLLSSCSAFSVKGGMWRKEKRRVRASRRGKGSWKRQVMIFSGTLAGAGLTQDDTSSARWRGWLRADVLTFWGTRLAHLVGVGRKERNGRSQKRELRPKRQNTA